MFSFMPDRAVGRPFCNFFLDRCESSTCLKKEIALVSLLENFAEVEIFELQM